MKTLDFITPTDKQANANIPFLNQRQEKKRKLADRKPNDFIGNVPLEKIEGIYKREEITTGIKRTAKIARKDILMTRKEKGFPKFSTIQNHKVITNTKQDVLHFTKQEQKSLSGKKRTKTERRNLKALYI